MFPCDSSRPIERRITVVTNAGWPFAAAPISTVFFGGRRSRCRAVSRHIGTVGVFAISVNHPVPRCLDLAFLAPAHPCADIGQPPIVTSVVTEFAGTGKAISGSRCQRQNDMLDAGMITRSCPTLTYRSSGAGLTARGATLAGVRRVIFFEPDQTPFASVAKTPEVTARSSLRSRDNRLEPPETRFSVHWKVQQITEAPKFFPQNRVRWLIGPVLRNKIERALSQFLARMKAVNLSNPNKFEP